MVKSRVLVVGGTGYLGRRIVRTSIAKGHPTFVLRRPEICMDIEKVQMLLSFKEQGATLVEGSFGDHQSLVDAVKKVDVVISAISGVHVRSHHILLQLQLVDAIKEAGNMKRFLPSEFGTDPARMGHALAPGRETFDDKLVVRKAIEESNIPFTYISANCFMGYFVGGLCQPGKILPSTESVCMLGDGNVKGNYTSLSLEEQVELQILLYISAAYVDENDIAMYIIKTIDDHRTLNKTIYIRPPENILSQREVVMAWEQLIGKELKKTSISEQDFLSIIKELEYPQQAGYGHFYHIFYEGCLNNFEIDKGEEASELYPEVVYTRVNNLVMCNS